MSLVIRAFTTQYADFRTRARRQEYWMFVLVNVCLYVVAALLDNVLGTTFTLDGVVDLGYGWIVVLYYLGALVPGLAVSVRRMHDVGKSGWFLLVALIPLAGAIWLLVLLCTDSQAGDNRYGPNPKTPRSNALGEIERLGTMYEKGLITAEEFAEQKSRVLSRR